VPTHVKAAPIGLISGDAEKGYDLYRGIFSFAGRNVQVGANLCFTVDEDVHWQRQVHSFTWLKDLHAGSSELHRAQARSLITDWLTSQKDHPACGADLDVTARRLISWLRHSSFLLERASSSFETTYFRSLGRHMRWLSRHLPYAPQNKARLEAALALSFGAVSLDMGNNVQDQALQSLCTEISAQILPDGGHVSRNPQAVATLLAEFLSLAGLLEKASVEVPQQLVVAIDRMMPMLKLLMHGDQGLAAFNGVGKSMKPLMRAILEIDDTDGHPAAHARYSGYGRLEEGKATAIIDCGLPPIPRFAEAAHAGLLSFEFSEGAHRIVVNCGAPAEQNGRWAKLARTTPAHSTAVLEDVSSSRISDNGLVHKLAGGPALTGARHVDCELDHGAEGSVFQGRHDGYADPFGLIHERMLWLCPQGEDFRGEDRFFEAGAKNDRADHTSFALRFHLHPSVKATLSQDASSVMLLLPDRSGWRFTAKGARIDLDESVYLVDLLEPQRSQQIVLTGLSAMGHKVNWAFKKITRIPKPAKSVADTAPELPL
ncbi:MAG: heparinase II/III family protein, partial [Hyphomicrobiales bacterium]